MRELGDAERHCTACARSVHDLGAMQRERALALLREHQGEQLCVRYRVDARGQVRFARPRQLGWSTAAAIALIASLGCTAPQLGLSLASVDQSTVDSWIDTVALAQQPAPTPEQPCEAPPDSTAELDEQAVGEQPLRFDDATIELIIDSDSASDIAPSSQVTMGAVSFDYAEPNELELGESRKQRRIRRRHERIERRRSRIR